MPERPAQILLLFAKDGDPGREPGGVGDLHPEPIPLLSDGFSVHVVDGTDQAGVGLDVEAGDLGPGQHGGHFTPAGAVEDAADVLFAFPVTHIDALVHPAGRQRP